MKEKKNESSLSKAIILLVLSIVIIIIGLKFVKASTSITLLVGGAITSAVAVLWGTKWDEIEKTLFDNVRLMGIGIFITMAIGLIVGSWILSGTIPTIIYYGMQMIAPSAFLFIACLLCSIMSLATGTSWGTIGTLGIALIGVSQGLGIPMQYTAGAIIVGAMFGDKLSPLSDTTIMAPAMSGTDIISHIKHMLYTTIPGYIISLGLYLVIGSRFSGSVSSETSTLILKTLGEHFNLNPLTLLPPIIVIALIVKKMPSIPVYAVGVLAGCVFALIFQGATLSQMAAALGSGFASDTGVEIVDTMLSRGGLNGTMSTVSIMLCAAVFGAPLKASGVLHTLVNALERSTKSWKTIMASSYIANTIFLLITTSYYVCFTVIGPIFQPIYERYGIPKKNLSRMLEDTSTALCWVIPWGMSGIYASGVFGVSVMDYALYAPMTWLGVVFAFIYIATGRFVGKIEPAKSEPEQTHA